MYSALPESSIRTRALVAYDAKPSQEDLEIEEEARKPARQIKRSKFDRRILNSICLDERITPNRRLLAAIIAMYLGAETQEDRMVFKAVLLGGFINRAGFQIKDKEDRNIPADRLTKMEARAAANISSVFSSVFEETIEDGEEGIEGDNDAA